MTHGRTRGNHQRDLAFWRMFFKVGDEGGWCLSAVFFEGFCEFAGDAHGAPGADRIEGGECFKYAMRRFEVDACLISRNCGGEFIGAATAFDRQESAEEKTVAWEA